jgi:hypothetical protein
MEGKEEGDKEGEEKDEKKEEKKGGFVSFVFFVSCVQMQGPQTSPICTLKFGVSEKETLYPFHEHLVRDTAPTAATKLGHEGNGRAHKTCPHL